MSRKSVKFMKNMLDQSEISFPNAKSILIDIGTPNMKEDDIAMLLQHNLIALQLNGGYSSTWFLRQVKRSAPKLRLLHLENGPWEDEWYPDLNFYSHAGWHPNPNWDPDVTNSANFIIAFKEQPNITHIELGQGWDNIIEEDLLTYFLLRPNLEMLCLGDNLPLLWPAMACLETDYPDAQILPKIRFLDISADKKSVKLLLSNLENLQGIHLEWKENMAEDAANGGFSRCEVLSWLSTCPRLEEIDLSGDVDLAIPLESFMDLAESCPLLRSLKIRNEFCCGDSETKVPEGFFEKLGHWITNLEQVHLPLSGAMSAECLEFFSRSCQNLNSPKPFKSTRARLLERLIEPIPGSKYNPET
ncbi:hypothetical protein N7456_000171 [Penicillium angulare]|uniref:Uncharacterized protein n=1 Tax=Penicillium angulare TaxID=116970 RepID=A0A9W9GD09_9EURO|nr:hypothetical protein N7456_000171 [Penicillium angulare]